MKKIKVLLSALAMVAAMAFVSCGGGAGDDPTGGKSGSGAVVFDGKSAVILRIFNENPQQR